MTDLPFSRYLPTERALDTTRLEIKRLADVGGEARLRFVSEAVEVIGRDYEEIAASFAETLVAVDKEGRDPNGLFTLGKEVWVLFNQDKCLVGYEVVTRKRGGSIKLGPTLLLEEFRGRGFAGEAIDALLSIYADAGARKVYVTAPATNVPTLTLDCRRLKLRVEALLRNQYSEHGYERVSSKFLRPHTYGTAELNFIDDDERPITFGVPSDLTGDLSSQVKDLIVRRLGEAYDDIDESFSASLIRGAAIGPNSAYEQKGRSLLLGNSEGRLVVCIGCTPKRGGALKIAPFAIEVGHRTRGMVAAAVEAVRNQALEHSRRKLYYVLPLTEWGVATQLLEIGLQLEGILASPYKEGVDVAVLSEFV